MVIDHGADGLPARHRAETADNVYFGQQWGPDDGETVAQVDEVSSDERVAICGKPTM